MITVMVAQRGLAVRHRETPTMIPDPGTIDGRWGPLAQTAFDAWAQASAPAGVSIRAQPIFADADREWARNVTIRPAEFEHALAESAGRYVAPSPTVAIARSGGSSTMVVVGGLLAGGAVVGLLAWFFLRND